MSNDAEYLDDVWWSRDFPVLREAVRAVDSPGGRNGCDAIAQAAGLTKEDGKRAFLSLERNGLVTLHRAGGTPIWVKDVAGHAYQLTGAYPSPESAADRLIAALEAMEKDAPPEQKSKIRQVIESIGGIGRDVFVDVVAGVISGRVPGAGA